MGTYVSRSGGGGAGGAMERTAAQDKALRAIDKRTANLKNEQLRVIDRDGNEVLKKQGTHGEVLSTVGEHRDTVPGNIVIHNHPEGGPPSTPDLTEFGYGATEIVVSSPEGTYRLINAKYNTPERYNGWLNMREDLDAATPEVSYSTIQAQAKKNLADTPSTRTMSKISNEFVRIRDTQGADAASAYMKKMQGAFDQASKARTAELKKERRRLEVQPFHDFYRKNAKKYGFIYEFTPRSNDVYYKP